jgi:hypothetical protein
VDFIAFLIAGMLHGADEVSVLVPADRSGRTA